MSPLRPSSLDLSISSLASLPSALRTSSSSKARQPLLYCYIRPSAPDSPTPDDPLTVDRFVAIIMFTRCVQCAVCSPLAVRCKASTATPPISWLQRSPKLTEPHNNTDAPRRSRLQNSTRPSSPSSLASPTTPMSIPPPPQMLCLARPLLTSRRPSSQCMLCALDCNQ